MFRVSSCYDILRREKLIQHGNDDFVTPEEAAALLDVSRRTVERYVEQYNIQKYKKGNRTVYKRSDIEKLIAPRPYDQKDQQ